MSQDSQIVREIKSGPINDTMNDPSRRHKIRKLSFYIMTAKRILQDGKWVQIVEEPVEE